MFWNVFICIIMVNTYLYAPQIFLAGYTVHIYTQIFLNFFGKVFLGTQIFRPPPPIFV